MGHFCCSFCGCFAVWSISHPNGVEIMPSTLHDETAEDVNLDGTAADKAVFLGLLDFGRLLGGFVVGGGLLAHPTGNSAVVGVACFLHMLSTVHSLTLLPIVHLLMSLSIVH